MNRHLVVMSVDAMVYEDFDVMRGLPHFAPFFTEGARVNRVRSCYPALTHPIHASIVTGCWPVRTGICNNEIFTPGDPAPDWYNNLSDIQVPTIFHAAHAAGYTSACSRWPVTSLAGDVIDYLVPEVLREEADVAAPLLRQGSGPIMADIVAPNLHRLNGNKRPNYDAFANACAADILRKYRPNLLFTHPGQVDTTRHRYGVFSDKVPEALALVDSWLGALMQAARDAGIYEQTDFVVLSDHGQLDIVRTLCPNVLFADAGLITLDAQGGVAHWEAYMQSAALSGQVFLRDPGDAQLCQRVYALLRRWCDEGIYGMSQVLTAEEAREEYHLAGGFSFVVETDGYTSFGNDWRRPLVRPLDASDYKYGHATHGHMPEKGPQPPLLCMGPHFAPGAVLETADIVDEAPTFARALGLQMPSADGKALEALLR
nr:ectonucleotide pyrophosphatase/phosphodiesterase [Maliibacterium massiliense]